MCRGPIDEGQGSEYGSGFSLLVGKTDLIKRRYGRNEDKHEKGRVRISEVRGRWNGRHSCLPHLG